MMSRFAMLCFGLAVLSTLTPTPGLGQTVATATAYHAASHDGRAP